jgi:hypothetical protein
MASPPENLSALSLIHRRMDIAQPLSQIGADSAAWPDQDSFADC